MAEPSRTETPRDELLGLAVPGHDLDCARAIYNQARIKSSPLDEIQVKHLLQIGYRAGRDFTRIAILELCARIEPVWSWSWRGPWLAVFHWDCNRVAVRGWTRWRAQMRALRVRARLAERIEGAWRG